MCAPDGHAKDFGIALLAVDAKLPHGFPAHVADSILNGIEAAVGKLASATMA